MFRKVFLATAVVAASMLAMSPSDADARWGARRAYRAPARVGVGPSYGYSPRRYASPRYYAPPRYHNAYRGGYRNAYRGYGYGRNGVSINRGGIYIGW